MEELRKKALELLQSGAVKVVIGYEKGSGDHGRPCFVRKPEDTGKLICDDSCLDNLAVYLHKPEVKKLGKPAIVAKLPVMRAILQLALENQIADGDIVVLGIGADGKLLELPDLKAVEDYVKTCNLELTAEQKALLEKLEKMSAEERWAFWQEQFKKCIKCYACRAGCPLCYCNRCIAECNQPQWIPVPPHDLGNFEWHIHRSMCMNGRCVNCGDCERGCPVGIPLTLLYMKMAESVAKNFGVRAGTAAKGDYPMSTFKPDDKENFIR
jgi:ferredoxin